MLTDAEKDKDMSEMEFGNTKCKEPPSEPGKFWYLPQYCVYHPLEQNKMCVVFDCSIKYKKLSLQI